MGCQLPACPAVARPNGVQPGGLAEAGLPIACCLFQSEIICAIVIFRGESSRLHSVYPEHQLPAGQAFCLS